MTKVGLALAGGLAFVGFAVAFAPARIVAAAAERVDGVALRDVGGTVWSGEGALAFRGFDIGRVHWSFAPAALLDAELGVDWRLAGAGVAAAGTLRRGFSATAATADGTVDADAVNRVLGAYHMRVEGAFEIRGVNVRAAPSGIADAAGELRWNGGGTVYRLSGRTYRATLPAIVAELTGTAGELVLRAASAESGTALVEARLDGAGWLHVGITKRLTVLAGKPWAGGGAPDAVVLTVAEQVL